MSDSDDYRFRVSDAVAVPLRGMLLRLRLVDGRALIDRLLPGDHLKLVSPDGRERTVAILDHAATAGRQTQQRVDTLGELDVIITGDDALGEDEEPVEIGWFATSP